MAKKRAKPAAVMVSRWISKNKLLHRSRVDVFDGVPKLPKVGFFYNPGNYIWSTISDDQCEAMYGFIPKPGECFRVESTVTKVK